MKIRRVDRCRKSEARNYSSALLDSICFAARDILGQLAHAGIIAPLPLRYASAAQQLPALRKYLSRAGYLIGS